MADSPLQPEARQHFDFALRHYNIQEYDRAVAEFKEAYKTDPRPELLYNIGNAQRLGGDCGAAIASYRAYLRESQESERTRVAIDNLKRCEDQIRAEKAEPPTESSTVVAPKASESIPSAVSSPTLVEPAKPPPPPRPRVARRAWLWATVAIAAALAGTGIALGIVYGSKTVDPPPPAWGTVRFGGVQ
jgi:hypothetical protein